MSGDFDQLTEVPSWLADLVADPVDVRIEGSSAGGEALFVGIAATDDVDRYLSGVAYDEVKSLDVDGRTINSVEYSGREGAGSPTAPGDEDFWEVSTEGVGLQSVQWSLERGNWTAVVMNADGSASVAADLSFGAKISNIVAIAWAGLAFAAFSLLGGGYLVYRGFRRRGADDPSIHTTHAPQTGEPPMSEQGPTEVEVTRELNAEAEGTRTASFFWWVNTHVKLITLAVLVLTIVATPLAMGRSDDEPNFDPSGEIYDTADLVDEELRQLLAYRERALHRRGKGRRGRTHS